MPGIAPRLPIQRDSENGFGLIKTYSELIKQNFKNLILTAPGERMMDPDFGVGIRNFLFLSFSEDTPEEIEEALVEQTSRYMPFVRLGNLDIFEVEDSQILSITIQYSVPTVGVADRISLQASLRNNEITAI
jgi:hypothetical protein